MRVHIRIVAGSLRGRKLVCTVTPGLRPAPHMVREALFSILGAAVPGRPFYDLFAGTGAVGLEALSRGAQSALLVERDFRVAAEIARHLRRLGMLDKASVVRADVYRWAGAWPGAGEPVNIFLGPPYPDFQRRWDDLVRLIADLQGKVAPASVIVLQAEKVPAEKLPAGDQWVQRSYGRNRLFIWSKP